MNTVIELNEIRNIPLTLLTCLDGLQTMKWYRFGVGIGIVMYWFAV